MQNYVQAYSIVRFATIKHKTKVFALYVWGAVRRLILKKITMTDMTTHWFSENNYLYRSDESERVANRFATKVCS